MKGEKMKVQSTIIREVSECLKAVNIPVRPPRFEDPRTAVATVFDTEAGKIEYEIHHDAEHDLLVFIIYFPDQLPRKNGYDIYTAMNAFNAESIAGHFAFSEVTNHLTFRFGYFLTEKEFNKRKFKDNFKKLLSDAREYYPLLIKLLTTEGATT
jgi:hypothetical protein